MSLFKITGLLLFIVFPIFLNGQNIVSRTNKRFSIGVSFSPDYSYRVLKTDASHQRLADMDNELYSPKFGNTSGLVLKYMVGEKLALESGIRFSDKGKKMVVNKGDLVDAFGNTVVDPAVPNKSTTVYHYQYIDIPLKLNYYILQKRIKFFVSGGVATDLFLSGKSKYVNEFNDRTERGGSDLEGDFNKVNFVWSLWCWHGV